jgi:hypothetical protein
VEEGEEEKKKKWRKSLLRTKEVLLILFQRLEAARKYIQQFNTEDDILVTCSKIENKCYAMEHKILDWLKKSNLFCFDFANDCYFMNLL